MSRGGLSGRRPDTRVSAPHPFALPPGDGARSEDSRSGPRRSGSLPGGTQPAGHDVDEPHDRRFLVPQGREPVEPTGRVARGPIEPATHTNGNRSGVGLSLRALAATRAA